MILAICQCHILSYIPSIWVSHSLLLSSFLLSISLTPFHPRLNQLPHIWTFRLIFGPTGSYLNKEPHIHALYLKTECLLNSPLLSCRPQHCSDRPNVILIVKVINQMKYFKIKNKPQLSPPLLSASAGPTTKAAQPRRPILATLVHTWYLSFFLH